MSQVKTILWICFVWPEPDSSAAGYRTKQLLAQLKSAGYRVTVSSACQNNSYQEALNAIGIETYNFAANDSRFNDFIRDLQPQIVFFDRFMVEEQFSWRVKQECPTAIRVLDTIDLHFLRSAREASLQDQHFCCDLIPENISDDAKFLRELAAIYRSDLTLLVSEFERELLVNKFEVSQQLLKVLPWGYPDLPEPKNFEQRKDLVWIGNFNHQPNRDSFELLTKKLWPEIIKLFRHNKVEAPELHIYGAYCNVELKNLTSAKRESLPCKVLGKAEKVFETLGNYKLNLAPLRYGAGLKGKVLDGWYVGTPCIATEIAAEGFGASVEFGGFIADSQDSFVKAVFDFYTKKELWVKASTDSGLILRDKFQQEGLRKSFEKLVSDLSESGPVDDNYVGQMLWHQQFRSAEFMSRWIELKNSK